jgi:hypothetical protein
MWVDIKANRLASSGKTEIVILLRRRDFTLPFCGDSQKHPAWDSRRAAASWGHLMI